MNKEFEEVLIMILIIIIFFIVIIGGACMSNSFQCSEVGKELNYKTQWHFWTGCIVEKPDGSKVLLKQMRDFERN